MVVMMWLLWQLALLLAMVSARHSKITPRNLTSLPRVPNLLPSEMPNMTDILLERFIIVPEVSVGFVWQKRHLWYCVCNEKCVLVILSWGGFLILRIFSL